MSNENEATVWINNVSAPPQVIATIKQYQQQHGTSFRFTEYAIRNWQQELICDLFGLLLFGPGFLGAHRTLLEPKHPNTYIVDLTDPTHPPYAIRHKMLVQAMHVLGWDRPLLDPGHAGFYQAEKEFLNYVLDDSYAQWAIVFDNAQLLAAITGMRRIFAPYPKLAYAPADSETLIALLKCLVRTLPPTLSQIDADGNPDLTPIGIAHILYAGWVYWEGRNHLQLENPLTFFLTNRLCDQALLHQRAISVFLCNGIV